MPPRTIEKRVEDLEIAMSNLSTLPAQVASLEQQFLQFRDEVRGEFSTIRSEFRGEMQEMGATLRGEIQEMGTALRGEIHDARNHAQILHEELIARISLIQEGFSRPKPNVLRSRKKR